MAASGSGEPSRVVVRVQFRGAPHEVAASADDSLATLGALLAAATGAAPASLRLLLPGRAVQLGDEAAAARSLRDAGLPPAGARRLILMGALAAELIAQQEAPAADATQRIAPPEHAAAVLARRRGRGPSALVLPPGPYTFASFRALSAATELTPPSAAALRLLHRLACDPGIVSIMTQRRWRVGLLSEMPPEGKVGVSEVCVLGYNVNQGQEIALRLRTDDMRGFRGYERIRETLLHELAHMVYSEHDLRFKALNSELTVAAARADWTRSTGRTLNGLAAWDVGGDDEEDYSAPPPPMSRSLGGASRAGRSAHEAAAAAAERRAAEARAARAEAAMAAEAAAALERARAAEAEEAAEAAVEAAADDIEAMDVTPQPAAPEAAPAAAEAAPVATAQPTPPPSPPADLDAELSRLAAGAEAARARAAAAAATLASGGSGAPQPGEASVALRTVAAVLRNALSHPGAPRYRVLPRRGGGAFEARAGRFAAAREVLSAAGFVEEPEPGGGTRLRLARDDPGLLWLALDAVNDVIATSMPQDVGGA